MTFKMKKPPEKPVRSKTAKEIDCEDEGLSTVKKLLEYMKKKNLEPEDVEIDYAYLTYWKLEDDNIYQERMNTYQLRLNEYKEWCKENKTEIEKYEAEQLRKKRKQSEEKAKRLREKIAAAEEELKILTIEQMTGMV